MLIAINAFVVRNNTQSLAELLVEALEGLRAQSELFVNEHQGKLNYHSIYCVINSYSLRKIRCKMNSRK